MKTFTNEINDKLKSENNDLCLEAFDEIVKDYGSDATDFFVGFFKNIDSELVSSAIFALGEIGNINAVIPMIKFALQYDPENSDDDSGDNEEDNEEDEGDDEDEDDEGNIIIRYEPSIRIALCEIANRQPDDFAALSNIISDKIIRDYIYEILDSIKYKNFKYIPLELCNLIGIEKYDEKTNKKKICNLLAKCLVYKNEEYSAELIKSIRFKAAITLYNFNDSRGIEYIVDLSKNGKNKEDRLIALDYLAELLENDNFKE